MGVSASDTLAGVPSEAAGEAAGLATRMDAGDDGAVIAADDAPVELPWSPVRRFFLSGAAGLDAMSAASPSDSGSGSG